jgi:methylthioribose-1-phosphate isomerase
VSAQGADTPLRAVWWEGDGLRILDQTRLPHAVEILRPNSVAEVQAIIRRLSVRGADAIGIAAAYALALEIGGGVDAADRESALRARADVLKGARPTAVHLAWAVERVLAALEPADYAGDALLRAAILREAGAIEREDRAMCRRIGEFGADLLEGLGVVAFLTHCNAGWLGTGGYGTALAPAYVLAERGRPPTVYSDESRPLLQGARLTTWELTAAGVPAVQIVDGAAASVMAQGLVGAVLVGADRIARSGDTANKIGTYGVAVLARHHGVPFYVAAPASAFDPRTASGADIPIEMRDPEEVRAFSGRPIAAAGAQALNPAFDVTPAALVTAFITDQGVLAPPYEESLPAAFGWR